MYITLQLTIKIILGGIKSLKDSDTPDHVHTQHKHGTVHHQEIKEIMRQITTITPENTLYEAARIMGVKHIGSLIVIKYETPVGIITERDLLREVADEEIALEKDWLAGGATIKEEKVEKIMTYPLITMSVNSSIKEAAQTMIEKRIRRIAVRESGKVVGIITATDLIRCLPGVPEKMHVWSEVDYFMSKGTITADGETSVENVARIMGKKVSVV